MSNWLIEILDGSDVWQPMSTGQVKSCISGTSSESQIIPDVSITFAADNDIPAGILDPELNRDTARLRITDGSSTRYFRIEKQPGSVEKGYDYPAISGRAYAGIITEWPPVTFDFLYDIYASDMARQVCTKNMSAMSGDVVGVVWLATEDPATPGGRWQVSRKNRFEMLKEIVTMCGAKLRVSEDGKYFEVYDQPSKSLTESATRAFSNPRSARYEMIRVKRAGNAIRVQGEQANYTRPSLPYVRASVSPSSIDADSTSTAIATAKVYDSSGQLVQHKAIIDEAITAGSYTEIPVSGCYSVEAVWLNSGSASAPTKGSRVDPTSFTASTITVPDNGTQLFIVSYTQAESVSFSLSDQGDEILGEAQNTTGALTVSTDEAIGRVIGVYRSGDTNRSGVNYYTGGSYTANTTDITLGITPGAAGTAVIIDYEEYNGSPLSASISPATALCNASGEAQSTIGAGSTVGTAKITASALGQEGSCWLSLLGSAIDSMTLTTDKSQILVGSSVVGQTNVSESNLTVQHDLYSSGQIAQDGYVVVSNLISGRVGISSSLDVVVSHYGEYSGEYRLYMRITNDTQYFTIGSSQVDISYNTAADIENGAGDAEITATVTQSDGSNVSDGTQVDFTVGGFIANSVSLSSSRAYTSSGVASVTLSAGVQTGNVTVYALCGSQRANLTVEVVDVVTDDDELGTVSYPAGASGDSDSGASGEISGKRRLICDDTPHVGVLITFSDGTTTTTDSGGYFSFSNGVTGTNTATATIDGEDYSFSWTCD